jgi:CheY-like chemotaxis protein
VGVRVNSEATPSIARAPAQDPAPEFAKRVLIVDPDQKMWELCARLLIAQGHVVRRISDLKDAPPRWPQHLYDLVVVATQDPTSPELVEFCNQLAQLKPAVRVALLVSGSAAAAPPRSLLISREQPTAAIADDIARLLR